jgi:hypothetical protein
MDPITLTIIVVGSSFVAFHVGYIIGSSHSFMGGFIEGADKGVKSVLEQLSKEMKLTFEYDVNVVDKEEKNNETE